MFQAAQGASVDLAKEERQGTTFQLTMDFAPLSAGFLWQVTSEHAGRPDLAVASANTAYASPARCASDGLEAFRRAVADYDARSR